MTFPALGHRPRSDALARAAHERQRLADAGLAVLFAAIFLGSTGVYLGAGARQFANEAVRRELVSPQISQAVDGLTVLRNLAAHSPADELHSGRCAG